MSISVVLCRAAVVALSFLYPAAWAAAPNDVDVPATSDVALPSRQPFVLEQEMVVHNWVLCVSQPVAEQLVRAREAGANSARETYASLVGARSCGQFPELRVILREPLYASRSADHDARIFGALVNLSGSWATAYVVSGGLPAE